MIATRTQPNSKPFLLPPPLVCVCVCVCVYAYAYAYAYANVCDVIDLVLLRQPVEFHEHGVERDDKLRRCERLRERREAHDVCKQHRAVTVDERRFHLHRCMT
jgi:hypothetical protein